MDFAVTFALRPYAILRTLDDMSDRMSVLSVLHYADPRETLLA